MIGQALTFDFYKYQGEIKMAKNVRLSPNQFAEEKGYAANLANITDYHPHNPDYSVVAIQAVITAIESATTEETQLLARLAEVRDILAENGTLLVQKNDGAVIQVAAQYGEDSPEYQSLGRKRKSERGTTRRRSSSGSSSGGNTPNG